MSLRSPGDEADNPYAPPGAEIELGTSDESPENLLPSSERLLGERRENLAAEATAKSIAIYYLVGAASTLLKLVLMSRDMDFDFLSGLSQFALLLLLGSQVLSLKNWARWTAIVFGGLDALSWSWVLSHGTRFESSDRDLLTGALGLSFAAYVVATLFSAKIGNLFSARYRLILKSTPQMHPRFSVQDRVFLGAFLLFQLMPGLARFL